MVDRNPNRYCQLPSSGRGVRIAPFEDDADDDDDELLDEDAAAAGPRTILITALAGALTAATVLCGWGLQVGADELAGRRVGRAVRGAHRLVLPERVFFQARLPAERVADAGGGLLPEFSDAVPSRQTARQLSQLENTALRASEYARQRSRLGHYLERLAELSRGQSAAVTSAAEIQNRAEYEALLMQADILQRELQEMRADTGRFESVASVFPESVLSAVPGAAERGGLEIAAAEIGESAESLTGERSPAVHCRKLLANLELNRRSTLAELAFVDAGEEFWRD